MGIFSSSSLTDQRLDLSERTLTNVAQENADAISQSLGGLTVKGGGKKSSTNVNADIEFTDFGAIEAGLGVAADGFSVVQEGQKLLADSFADQAKENRKLLEAATSSAIRAAEASSGKAIDTVRKGQDRVIDFSGDALDFALASEELNADLVEKTIGGFQDSNENTIDFAGETIFSAFDFAETSGSQLSSLAEKAIGGFQSIADSATERAFASSAGGGIDASRDLVKYVALAAVAAVGLMVFVRR